MDDMEKVFAEGLRRAASGRPALPIDVDEVIARGEAAGRASVRRPAWRWLAVAAAVLLVAGVGAGVWFVNRPGSVPAVPVGSPSATSVVLTGTRWLATEIEGRPVETVPAGQGRERVPWLEFGSTTMSGGDPCNGVGADYRLDGDRLTFSNWGATTDVGCNTAQQQRFVQALQDTARVQRDGDSLVFLDASGRVVLKFRGQTTGTSASLTGTEWVLADFWDVNGKRTAVDASMAPTLFLVDGRVAAGSPCGRFAADYAVDQDRLTVGDLAVTGADCAVARRIPWFALRSVVAGPVTYRITDTTLELRDDHGGRLARFVAGLGPTAPPVITPAVPSGSVSVQGQVTFRVRNDTTVRLTGITAELDDGVKVGFGPLDPGESDHLVSTAQPVYRYPLLGATLHGRRFELRPTDSGEEWPVAPGEYTYVLSVDAAGELMISLEKDR